MKKTSFLTTLIFLCNMMISHAQNSNVITATGGIGKYKNDIKWLNFENLSEIKAGTTVTKNFKIGDVTVTVVIKDISFSGKLGYNESISNQRLTRYYSGEWSADGLVKLYNIGVNDITKAEDRAKNKLYNALKPKISGDLNSGALSYFTIEAYALLNGQAMDLGLVYANAEEDADGYDETKYLYTEYTKGTTNGSAWQLLEKYVNNSSGRQEIKFSNNGQTAKSSCGSGNVAVMYTKKQGTTSSLPLQVKIEMLGGGNSAVALGVVLGYDIGDAPLSYGTPANVSFYDIEGGNRVPPSTTTTGDFTNYLSQKGGAPVIMEGTPKAPQSLKIGAKEADTDPYDTELQHSAFANIDDNTNIDDEDGLSTIKSLLITDSKYELTFKATATTKAAAYVTAWIDLNRDGVFNANEYKSATIAANTTSDVKLVWDNLGAQNVTAGISYIRLRISSYDSKNSDNTATNVDERSTMALSGGETEDYRFEIHNTICVDVFHDANGLLGSPINTIDGTLKSNINGNAIIATIYDESGKVIDSKTTNNGSFSFIGPYYGKYTVKVTVDQNNPLPKDWVYTGEAVAASNTSSGSDGSPDGILSVVSKGKDLYTKFGIQQRPTANNQYIVVNNPKLIIDKIYSFPSVEADRKVPQLSGYDPEDLPFTNLDSISNGGKFTITKLPPSSDAIIYYNGSPLGAGAIISNYTPENFQIEFKRKDIVSLNFEYTITDKAGFTTTTPATYTIDFVTILPATGLNLNAQQRDGKTYIQWKTLTETNSNYFEIEKSVDGTNFVSIGKTNASKHSNSEKYYDFYNLFLNNFVTYYRVVLYNNDGSFTRSNIIRIQNNNSLSLYPNPAKTYTVISGLTGSNEIYVRGNDGKTLHTFKTNNNSFSVDMNNLPKGIYWISVSQEQNVIKIFKLLKD